MSRFYWILGIASGLVAAAWTVSAQPTPPNALPPDIRPGPSVMGFLPPPPGFPPGAAMMAHRAAGRAYLEVRLDLTPEQIRVWQELETVAGQDEAEERRACARMPTKPDELSLMQRLDRTEERATLQLAHLRKVSEAFKKLAAMLSPEQQRLIDQSMPPLPL